MPRIASRSAKCRNAPQPALLEDRKTCRFLDWNPLAEAMDVSARRTR